mgnify:CR=1 FL=1
MRKLAMVMALASTAIATPALARDDSWYVGIAGGGMIVEDIDYSITNSAAPTLGGIGRESGARGFRRWTPVPQGHPKRRGLHHEHQDDAG